jgi:hypothetical protein
MNKIHENIYYSESFYHISISTQISHWFNLSINQNLDEIHQNYTKFIKIGFWNSLKQFTRQYCAASLLSAHGRNRPTAISLAPAWARGPAANRQAAEAARAPRPLGPIMARLAPFAESRPCLQIGIGRLSGRFAGTKLAASTPCNPSSSSFCSPASHARTGGGGDDGFVCPAAGDGRRRWRAAAPGTRPRPAPPFFSAFDLSPLHPITLALHRQDPERGVAMVASGEAVVGAAAGPHAGARVHPRVSAPPSSGSLMAHAALSLTPASCWGPASAQLALSVRTARTMATPTVVMER